MAAKRPPRPGEGRPPHPVPRTAMTLRLDDPIMEQLDRLTVVDKNSGWPMSRTAKINSILATILPAMLMQQEHEAIIRAATAEPEMSDMRKAYFGEDDH